MVTTDPRKCAGRVRSENLRPCRRWAIRGGTVCPKHGGSAPQVKAAARRRVQDAALPHLTAAINQALTHPTPATLARARRAMILLATQAPVNQRTV